MQKVAKKTFRNPTLKQLYMDDIFYICRVKTNPIKKDFINAS